MPEPIPAPLTEDAATALWNRAHLYAARTDVPRISARICAEPASAWMAGYAAGREESAIRASRPTLTDEPSCGATNTEQWVGASSPPSDEGIELLRDSLLYWADKLPDDGSRRVFAHDVQLLFEEASRPPLTDSLSPLEYDSWRPALRTLIERMVQFGVRVGAESVAGQPWPTEVWQRAEAQTDVVEAIQALVTDVCLARDAQWRAVRAESRPPMDDERAGWNADLLNASNELEKAQERILDLENELAESRPDAALTKGSTVSIFGALDMAENTLTLVVQNGGADCFDAPEPGQRCNECSGCSVWHTLAAVRHELALTGRTDFGPFGPQAAALAAVDGDTTQ